MADKPYAVYVEGPPRDKVGPLDSYFSLVPALSHAAKLMHLNPAAKYVVVHTQDDGHENLHYPSPSSASKIIPSLTSAPAKITMGNVKLEKDSGNHWHVIEHDTPLPPPQIKPNPSWLPPGATTILKHNPEYATEEEVDYALDMATAALDSMHAGQGIDIEEAKKKLKVMYLEALKNGNHLITEAMKDAGLDVDFSIGTAKKEPEFKWEALESTLDQCAKAVEPTEKEKEAVYNAFKGLFDNDPEPDS